MEDRFTIRRCLIEEAKEGWVWIPRKILNTEGNLIRITNPKTGKSIVIVQREIEKSYENRYNKRVTVNYRVSLKDSFLVLSGHYREKLGIKVNQTYSLKISSCNHFDRLTYLYQHPHEVVVNTYIIAVVSILLSVAPYICKVICWFCNIKCDC